MVRSIRTFAVTLGGAAIMAIAPLSAASATPSQLRFSVSPPAADPVWKTPGVKFEKRGECSFKVPGAAATPMISGRGAMIQGFKATAPLFNPGQPQPNGSYSSQPDDGYNTLFIDMTFPGDPNSVMTCQGYILANGVVVSTAPASGWPSATIMQIGGSGPLTVKPQLDKAKFAAADPSKGVLFNGQAVITLEKSANGTVEQLTWLDLDKGAVSYNPAGADFQFSLGWDANQVMLLNTQQSELADEKNTKYIADKTPEGYRKHCEKQPGGIQNIYLRNPASDGSFDVTCVRTTEGRLALLYKVSGKLSTARLPDGRGKQRLDHTFAYIVWK